MQELTKRVGKTDRENEELSARCLNQQKTIAKFVSQFKELQVNRFKFRFIFLLPVQQ